MSMASTTGRQHSALRTATADDGTAWVRGHEGPIVQPSSYLRPRGLSHPMAFATAGALSERAIDREERQGLVSVFVVVVALVSSDFPARSLEREETKRRETKRQE